MVIPSRPDRTKTPVWNLRRAPSLSVSPSGSPPLHLCGPSPEPCGLPGITVAPVSQGIADVGKGIRVPEGLGAGLSYTRRGKTTL